MINKQRSSSYLRELNTAFPYWFNKQINAISFHCPSQLCAGTQAVKEASLEKIA